MKEFCFWDEDDISNLPLDFKLVPFNVAYIEEQISETPKTLTSKKSQQEHIPSTTVKPGICNQNSFD